LLSVCAIVFPDPAAVPVNEAALVVTVQLKAEPATLLVKAIEVVPPEQKLCVTGVADATGVGFTSTSICARGPSHPDTV
jgi:hypothetical protein